MGKSETIYKAEELHFCGGQTKEAESLVIDCHYSKRVPSSVSFIGSFHLSGGLFGDQGEMVAACFFGSPAVNWSEKVLELSRLVRQDNIRVPLSRLISLSVAHLKKNGHDLLISYADQTQGHKGYVYKACSWNYSGLRKPRLDGYVIDGKFTSGRACNHIYGTTSQSAIKESFPHIDIEPHYDLGKHLYWKALNKQGKKKAERLGLSDG